MCKENVNIGFCLKFAYYKYKRCYHSDIHTYRSIDVEKLLEFRLNEIVIRLQTLCISLLGQINHTMLLFLD